MAMSSRERILTTINHKEPDRVPLDLGGHDASTIMVGPYRKLCEYLGIDVSPIYVADVIAQCVIVDAKLAEILGVDAKEIYLLPERWTVGEAYDGSEVLLPESLDIIVQPDGSRIIQNEQGNPELKMPKGGYYFDVIDHPLKEIKSVSDIDTFMNRINDVDRPSWADLSWDELGAKTKKIRDETDRLLIGSFQGHIFQSAQILRGWAEFMRDLVARPDLAEALMDRLAEAHMRAFDHYSATVGKFVDIILVCDDLGMQNSTWMSPNTYRKLIKPYHARLYEHIKTRSGLPILLHSDGSIYPLIPDLIEIGVDALNPVQYNTKDMELKKLKQEFGNDICFWGGGVDTQKTLPLGTPEQVAEEVKRNIDILAPGGGFVFAAVHNVIEGVPAENILATYRTAAEYGVY